MAVALYTLTYWLYVACDCRNERLLREKPKTILVHKCDIPDWGRFDTLWKALGNGLDGENGGGV